MRIRLQDGSGQVEKKYLTKDKDRRGNERIYFRRPGQKKIRLRSLLGSKDFFDEYDKAYSGKTASSGLRETVAEDSFRWLCIEYKKSASFKGLDDSTKRVRTRLIDRLCRMNGAEPYAVLKPMDLYRLQDKFSGTPATANQFIIVIRQVYKFAVKMGHVNNNPALEIKLLPSNNPDGFKAWEITDIEKFEKTHPVGTKARLALALLLYTCQRRSDVVRFGKQHVKGQRLEFTQFKGRNKNPTKLSIPIISELQKILDASPCGDLTFIVTSFNKPFSSNGFGNRFRKWCDQAGLPNLSAHGLRKAAAARMAELGCTHLEIMAIGGWKTLKELLRYTESARQKLLANSASSKIEYGHKQNEIVPLSDEKS